MTLLHCAFGGCSRTVEHDDMDLWPPKGWSHISTSGDDPRIGPCRRGFIAPCMARRSTGASRALINYRLIGAAA
jgi:hypothetical protein